MATIESTNGVTLVTGATAADSGFMQSYNPGSSYFCANGLEVTISARTDGQGGYTASWTYEGVNYSRNLNADVVLIGGAWDEEVASASIIMNGGTVNHVYGGGVTADAKVTGDINVVVNAGTLINLNGAGGCGAVGGNVNITVGNADGGPTIAHDIIGGGWFEGADVAGNATITLVNGKLGNAGPDGYPCEFIAGGGVFADVKGKVTVNVIGGQYDAIVTGGAMIDGVVNAVEINMQGGEVIQLNGSCIDYYVKGSGSVGDVVINVSGGTVKDAVIGGSIYKADVTGTVEINVTGGTINTYGGAESIIAGSNFIPEITGTTSVNITTTGENAPVLNGAITKYDAITIDGNAIDKSTCYVDSTWAEKTVGTQIAEGQYFGLNAFASMDDAVKAVDATVSKIIAAGGQDVSLHASVTTENENGLVIDMGNNNLTVDKKGSYAVIGGGDPYDGYGAEFGFIGGDLTVGKNVTLNADILWANEGNRTIDGTLNVNGAYVRDNNVIVNGALNVADTFTVMFATDKVLEIAEGAKFTAKNVYIDYNNTSDSSFGVIVNGNAAITDGEFISTDSSVIVGAAGILALDNADFALAGTLTNNGTVTVTGETTINVEKTTGSQLKFTDVALVGDSSIGGNIFVFGEFSLDGTLTLKQTNFASDANAVLKEGSAMTGSIAVVTGYLAVNKNASLSVKFLNAMNGGEVDIAGAVNITNDSRANYSNLVMGGGTVNVASTGSIMGDTFNGKVHAGGVLNINGGSVEFTKFSDGRAGKFLNEGTVNMTAGKLSAEAEFNNSGSIILGSTATLTAGTLVGAGTITINAAGFKGYSHTAIDITGDTAADFSKVTLENNADNVITAVFDNDLYIVDTSTILIGATEYEGVEHLEGVTAFDTIEEAEALTDGARKFVYVANANGEVSFSIGAVDGMTTVKVDGKEYMIRAGQEKVFSFAAAAGDTHTFEFVTDTDYTLESATIAANVGEDLLERDWSEGAVTGTINVGSGAGDMVYSLDIDSAKGGNIAMSFTDLSGFATYQLLDAAGNVIGSGTSNSGFNKTFTGLAQGGYTLVFSGEDLVSGDVSINVANAKEDAAPETWDPAAAFAVADGTVGGLEGSKTYSFAVAENTVGDLKLTAGDFDSFVKCQVFDGDGNVLWQGFSNSGFNKTLTGLAAGSYQIVLSADKESNFDLNMEMTKTDMPAVEANDPDNDRATTDLEILALGDSITDWVGASDSYDWIDLDFTATGYKKVSLQGTGSKVTAEVWRVDGEGNEKCVSTFSATNSTATRKVMFSAGYEYFVKIVSADSKASASTDYTLAIN